MTATSKTTNGKQPDTESFERAWNAFQNGLGRQFTKAGGFRVETMHGTFLVSQFATFVDLVTPEGAKWRKVLPFGKWREQPK